MNYTKQAAVPSKEIHRQLQRFSVTHPVHISPRMRIFLFFLYLLARTISESQSVLVQGPFDLLSPAFSSPVFSVPAFPSSPCIDHSATTQALMMLPIL